MLGSTFASPPGTIISNQADLQYQNAAGMIVVVPSNEVSVVTTVIRSASNVEFTRVLAIGTGDYQELVGPSSCFLAGAFQLLADPVLTGGTPLDPTEIHEVSTTAAYNLGEPLFIRLLDNDQNIDNALIDTAVINVEHDASGDVEIIQLSESGVNTGVFVGFVPTARAASVPGDCILQGSIDSSVRVTYTDPADSADATQAGASLDPVGTVFESRTGSPANDIQVDLLDATTGLPAVVYGNDGISTFPATIFSGSTVVDSSGVLYVFGAGEYRFPVVPGGSYRLVVTPPPEYNAPSAVSEGELQLLPGAPFSLGPESFGAAFVQAGTPAVSVDLPIDPTASALFLQKQSITSTAAPGDFVRYELSVENTSTVGALTSVIIVDQLPPGVRFVTGSVTINGASEPDPFVASDMRTLEFDVGILEIAERTRIHYVVEIVGGERNDELVNRATAFAAGGLFSNEATATIRLTEDLFRSTGTIIGRVLDGDCSQESFSEDQGIADIRIYTEDGRYAVTDSGGRFHFEGIKPGAHIAQLDTTTVPAHFDVIGCADSAGFSGSSESQFVKVARGGLHRADFYLRRKAAPEGRIELELRNVATDSIDAAAYELVLNGIGNIDISNIKAMIMLPDGVSYEPGSMTIGGQKLGEPKIMGQAVMLALVDQTANWSNEIHFVAQISDQVSGELTTRATVLFDSPIESGQKTPVAETKMIREPGLIENEGYVLDLKFGVLSDKLSPQDILELSSLIEDWRGVRNIQIMATGHSDSQGISAARRSLFANNYVLSQARAMSAAFFLADALDVATSNIQVGGRGPDDPVADNATAAGRQKNRRVEIVLSGLRPRKPSFLEVTQASSGTKETATKGAVPGLEIERARLEREQTEEILVGTPKSQKEPALEELRPGISILLPKESFQPAIPASKVSIKHAPGQSVKLTINGRAASPLNFDATVSNRDQTVAVSRWRTVALDEGENELRAVVSNADGTLAEMIIRTIYFAGVPIRGEIDFDASNLVADGKTRPVVAVRLYDRQGQQSRPGMVGAYRVNAPYRSWWDVEKERENELVVIGQRESLYRVEAGGLAYIELEPTTRTGEVTLDLKFENHREQEIRAWLKPAPRDWILVAFGEGTSGHTTISSNAIAAAAAGHEEGYYDEGRIAFFAKGQIKGEFLLTLAYDSDRRREDNRERFDTVVDPNAYYPLYADKSEQRFEAASQRKLYVKLERNQFYALFGDMDTGLSVTDLTRYQRRFNGLKSEFRGRNIGYSVFAAESDQSFIRDELRGDGTSGLYQLSRTPIIAHSDLIRIEVRDRFDSGVVISSTTLSRFLDYNLDALSGNLYFKKPVPSRDMEFNPVYIVAEYEVANLGGGDLIAGGRVSARVTNDSLEVGVTHINDQTRGAEADLSGFDLRWQINEQTLMRAEFATTNTDISGVAQSGNAQYIDIEHNGENLDIRAYIREVDDEFGMGYQSAADKGVRRLGVNARGKLGDFIHIEGEAAWQEMLLTGDTRSIATSRARFEKKTFTAMLGLAHAEDKFDDGDSRTSDLLELGVTKRLLGNKLMLRASGSTSIGEEAANIDYPTSVVVGADYRISQGVDLIVEYEDSEGRDIAATMTRVGVRATPWNRAQINTGLTSEQSEFGPRLFANLGLVQGFQFNENWMLDVGIDQSRTLRDTDARIFDPDRELVSGSLNPDFLALYTGALYSSEDWSANARIESRESDIEDRLTLLFGWYRAPTEGHGLSSGLTIFNARLANGNEMTSANFKFGWAYRKADRKWSFLNRVDVIFDSSRLGINEEDSWRLINNFNANRRISAATSLSLQYAFKYVRSNFDSLSFTGYTDLVGVDLRHGFRDRWDVGVTTSVYHSYRSKVMDYGLGVDVGYNVGRDMWLTLGYNFEGFDDKDFAVARYTASGPYLRFTIKADHHILRRIAGRR